MATYRASNNVIGRRAHEGVTIQSATVVAVKDECYWAVSGDHTTVEDSLISYPVVWGMSGVAGPEA